MPVKAGSFLFFIYTSPLLCYFYLGIPTPNIFLYKSSSHIKCRLTFICIHCLDFWVNRHLVLLRNSLSFLYLSADWHWFFGLFWLTWDARRAWPTLNLLEGIQLGPDHQPVHQSGRSYDRQASTPSRWEKLFSGNGSRVIEIPVVFPCVP